MPSRDVRRLSFLAVAGLVLAFGLPELGLPKLLFEGTAIGARIGREIVWIGFAILMVVWVTRVEKLPLSIGRLRPAELGHGQMGSSGYRPLNGHRDAVLRGDCPVRAHGSPSATVACVDRMTSLATFANAHSDQLDHCAVADAKRATSKESARQESRNRRGSQKTQVRCPRSELPEVARNWPPFEPGLLIGRP